MAKRSPCAPLFLTKEAIRRDREASAIMDTAQGFYGALRRAYALREQAARLRLIAARMRADDWECAR